MKNHILLASALEQGLVVRYASTYGYT